MKKCDAAAMTKKGGKFVKGAKPFGKSPKDGKPTPKGKGNKKLPPWLA